MKIRFPLLSFCLFASVQIVHAVPVTVEVVDEKGAPVAGALVLVQSFAPVAKGEKPLRPSQTSGADGLAKFDLQGSEHEPEFFGRSVVFKAGYGIGGGDLSGPQLRVPLRASAARSGRVVDGKGAPIIGAKVELDSIRQAGADPFDGHSVILDQSINENSGAQTQTVTDEKGEWQFKDLPTNSEFGLTITADGFADTGVRAKAGADLIETKLPPEARINGQLLAPDGTPLEGVTVRIAPKEMGEYWGGEGVTDAQGKFAVRGLTATTFDVYFRLEDKPFIAAKINEFVARVGDNALPMVQAQTGVIVRGTVRTDEGQPVVVGISANEGQQSAETDEKGAYELRVLPGENVFSLDLYNNKYRNARDKQTLQIAVGESATLDWTLQIAPIIKGIVTNEKGAPVKAKLFLTGAMSNDTIEIQSDETGRFEAPAPFEGELTFGDSMWDKAEWDVVGRQTVKLPFRGELKLVVKPTVRRVFATRVTDETGAPLAGVQLDANVWAGQSGRGHKLFSDEKGVFRIENITPRETITQPSISKDGYQLRGEIKVLDDGGDITTSPLVMVKSAATARGTVINEAGQNAARARVTAASVEVIADESGAFKLDNLPAGELLVSALSADERSFGAATTPLKEPITLRVPTLVTRDRALAQSIIDALKVEAAGTDYWAKDQLGFPDDDFVARVKASATPLYPFYALDTDASISTEQALEGFALLNKSNDILRAGAQIVSWRTDWKDDPRAGELVARLEEEVANELGKAANFDSVYNAGGVFALAAAYEAQGATESADRAFKTAIDWAFKTFAPTGDQGRESALNFSAGVFAGTPRLMAKLLTYFEPEGYRLYRTLVETQEPMARARGLSALASEFEAVSKLPNSRETVTLDQKRSYYVLGNLLTLGIKMIRDNGERDPVGALAIAELMREDPAYGQSDQRNRAFAEAAFWQTPARAAEIWRAQLPTMKPENAISYAARIQEIDPQLARELYEIAREQFESKLPLADSRKDTSSISFFSIEIGQFAFYEAQFEPARALYRLEKEWGASAKDNYKLRDFVRAMGRLDPQRALEMAAQLPMRNDYRFDARRNLALRLWSGETQREW